ncbi:MAG: DUF3494 domain-containing protein [Massilia sp.]|nr:DUF3494 domain-containing protein [Aquabacterium sp.]
MFDHQSLLKSPRAFVPILLLALLSACGGDKDPVLGNPGAGIAPTVTVTLPLGGTPAVTGVATNSRVSATFSKPMTASSFTPTSFTVACPAGSPVSATVAYNATTQVATLTPTLALPPSTLCVATLTTAIKDSTGLGFNNNYVWGFTTAALADATRPSIVLTAPAAGDASVPINRKVIATFSEPMNAATISGTSFTVRNTTLNIAVAGNVSYSVSARTATFTPSTPATLAPSNSFTATLTTAATDLAGNALAGNTAALPGSGNHVWVFTTAAGSDAVAPTVTAISPADSAPSVCTTKIVSATFSEPMDEATITTATLRVTDSGTPVAGTVAYDATNQVASFVPNSSSGFASNKPFVVTVVSGNGGVKDLAGNALASDRAWGFTTSSQACTSGINLRTIASFGAFGGGAGVTNQGINTVVTGDLGTTAACTLITGFHDSANTYTETTGSNVGPVNGSVYCGPPAPGTTTTMAIATQARADAQSAYDDLAAMPPGSDPAAGQLGGQVLPPAVYTSAGGTFDITTGDLTLDAQGDANAVWVFQSASALTVGLSATPRQVLLINGAQAKNVFWQVGSAARIEDGSVMVGTIIAPAGVTISTPGQTIQTTLTGRAIGLTASVTMVNTSLIAP